MQLEIESNRLQRSCKTEMQGSTTQFPEKEQIEDECPSSSLIIDSWYTFTVPNNLTSSRDFRAPVPTLGSVDCRQMIFPPLADYRESYKSSQPNVCFYLFFFLLLPYQHLECRLKSRTQGVVDVHGILEHIGELFQQSFDPFDASGKIGKQAFRLG